MQQRVSQQIIAVAPAIALGGVAVALASTIDATALRFILQATAIVATVAASCFVVSEEGNRRYATAQEEAAPQRVQSLRIDRRRATFDPDTGLHAEWYFRLRVQEEMARAKRYGQAFSLLVFSAKSAGTLDVARLATTQWLREVDFAGDLNEMIVLCLPNTDRAGAAQVVDRLTKLVKDLDVRVAEFPEDGETFSALIGQNTWHVDKTQGEDLDYAV